MIENFTTYLFHPVIILCRLWKIIYLPLLFMFDLSMINHDNVHNSHVLSLLYSIITSCISPYTFYLIYNNTILVNQASSISEFIYNLSISYFISDLIIGLEYYPTVLNNNILTSYIHHSAYIILLSYLKQHNKIHLLLLGMPYEIPTVLLNIRYVSNYYNNYKLFGILFLFFRIFYNIYVLYKTYNVYNDIFIFSIGTLMIHCYWYFNYLKRYVF